MIKIDVAVNVVHQMMYIVRSFCSNFEKISYTHVCGSTEPRRSLNSEISQQILEIGLRVIK